MNYILFTKHRNIKYSDSVNILIYIFNNPDKIHLWK